MPRWPSATWRAVCASWHGLHPDRRLLQTSRRSGRSEIGTMWSTVFAAVSRPRLWHHQHNGSALSLASRSLRHALSYPRDAAEPRQRSCAWRWAAAPPCVGWWTGGRNGIGGAARLSPCAQAWAVRRAARRCDGGLRGLVCTRTVASAQPDDAFQAVCDLGNESDEAQTTTAPVLGRTAPRTGRSDTT